MAKKYKQHYATRPYTFDGKQYYVGDPIPRDVVDNYGPRFVEERTVGHDQVAPLAYKKADVLPEPEVVIEDLFGSPEAEVFAKESGLTDEDIASIKGSGKGGKIIKPDVDAFVAARDAA